MIISLENTHKTQHSEKESKIIENEIALDKSLNLILIDDRNDSNESGAYLPRGIELSFICTIQKNVLKATKELTVVVQNLSLSTCRTPGYNGTLFFEINDSKCENNDNELFIDLDSASLFCRDPYESDYAIGLGSFFQKRISQLLPKKQQHLSTFSNENRKVKSSPLKWLALSCKCLTEFTTL
jgi:hypothetical protein